MSGVSPQIVVCRIWTPDAAASTSRNATIYCGAEILSLEWENKSDRLVICPTLNACSSHILKKMISMVVDTDVFLYVLLDNHVNE